MANVATVTISSGSASSTTTITGLTVARTDNSHVKITTKYTYSYANCYNSGSSINGHSLYSRSSGKSSKSGSGTYSWTVDDTDKSEHERSFTIRASVKETQDSSWPHKDAKVTYTVPKSAPTMFVNQGGAVIEIDALCLNIGGTVIDADAVYLNIGGVIVET